MVKLNIAGRLEAPRVQEAETPAAPEIAPDGASAALGDGPAVAVAEAPATTIVATSGDPVSAVETNGHAAEPAPESEPRRAAGEPGDN